MWCGCRGDVIAVSVIRPPRSGQITAVIPDAVGEHAALLVQSAAIRARITIQKREVGPGGDLEGADDFVGVHFEANETSGPQCRLPQDIPCGDARGSNLRDLLVETEAGHDSGNPDIVAPDQEGCAGIDQLPHEDA
jgi:hypothetical protein